MSTPRGDQPLIELDNVSVITDANKILTTVDWVIEAGQHWVVLGPNGGGKSTLIRVASLAQHPTDGSVAVFGHRLGTTDIRQLKSRIGVASGSLADQLRPRLSAEEVVRCGRFAALEPWWHKYSEHDSERALSLLGQVGLAGQGERSFGTLSSGERQRALLARSLMNDPEVLILDEPTAGLDLGGRERLVAALETIAADGAPATVFVTHHVEDIPRTATHLLAVAAGRVVAAGPLESVMSADLLGSLFGLQIDLQRQGRRWSARSVGIA